MCKLFILRNEQRLRETDKRDLVKIFGLKRDEIARGSTKLHNGELHEPYSSPNIIGMTELRLRWARLVTRI
jgi:hypothetical protein